MSAKKSSTTNAANGTLKEKAAIYIRVSTQWQVDKDSLQVQRRELTAYANMVLNISDTVVFEDPGYSAKNTDRPDYQAMMERLRTGEFSHLLVWKIDRISRNLLDFASMYAELKRLGVTFVSKNEQFDTSSAIGGAMLKIILVFAELEREMTAERVSAVMISRASEGKWNGGKIPYGYSYDKETKQFEIVDHERRIFNRVWDLYEEQQSIVYVTRKLNEAGLCTRSGNAWTSPTIYKLLTSPWYTGSYVYNVREEGNGYTTKPKSEWIVTEDHHPALVDQARYDRMQIMLKRNKRGGHDYSESRVSKNIHIFAGLVKCGLCGEAMTATLGQRRASGWRPSVYGCRTRRNNNSKCSNKYISDIVLGPFVFNFVSNIIKAKEIAGPRTSNSTIQERLLKGRTFWNVDSIGQEGLQELCNVLRSGITGIEYKPKTVFADDENRIREREILENRKRKDEIAFNRLRSLYLFADGDMSEKDYLIQQQELLADLENAKARLDEISSDDTSELTTDQEFIEQASYFIMVQKLLDEKEIDFDKYIRGIEPEIPRNFIRKIISSIESTDGKITAITFSNGITTKFIYKA